MIDLTTLIRQFTVRYRAALLAKAGLLCILVFAVLGVLAWRLHALRIQPVWSLGLPGACALLVAGSLAWWLHRRWISDQHAPAHLDQALGLQQRLVTVAEFSKATQVSPLYSLLLEDTARRYTVDRTRFPKPLDRTAGALIAVLILLLCMPGIGRAPVQLTQLPRPPVPPQPHPLEQPPPDQRQDEQHQQQQRQQQGASTQSPSSGAPGANQQSSGGAGQSSQQSQQGGSGAPSSNMNQSSQSGGSGQSGQGQGQQQSGSNQGQPQRSGDVGRASGADGSGASGAQEDRNRPTPSGGAGSQERAAASTSESGQGHQQTPSGGGTSQNGQQINADNRQQAQGNPSQTTNRQGQSQTAKGSTPSGAQQAQGSDGAGQRAASSEQAARALAEQQAGAQGQGPSQQASENRSPGSSGSGTGNQEAMKAEIQQLLQQVSGELKDLQAQLASANEQMKPQAGTGTDTQLYEAPMPSTPSQDGAEGSLPMQLQTDAAPTQSHRPGGGLGQPGEEASQSAPQAAPEDAQLSNQPLEEQATSHQAVPPEYRGIFGNLHQRQSPQPSGAPAIGNSTGGQTSETR